MQSTAALAIRFSNDTPGLVAIINDRADLERARTEHWYRIPVRTAPDGLLSARWVAFYLTASFGTEKWSVRYWAVIQQITEVRRIELLPAEPDHPRANDPYYRLALGSLEERGEPIFSRRRRRIVFIPTVWHKFVNALEINDLHHGSPLEDRLWAALKQEGIDAERQWFEGTRDTLYCLDFAVFCPERNIDVECDGDTWHSNPERAREDNARNNFLEQRGWHVLRFNSGQLNQELAGCVQGVRNTIHRCGGLCLPDGTVRCLDGTGGKDASAFYNRLPHNRLLPPGASDPAIQPGTGPDRGTTSEVRALLALAKKGERRSVLAELESKHGTGVLAGALASAMKVLGPRLRERAVWCLGEIGQHPMVVEALAACLSEESKRNIRGLAYSICAKIQAYQLEDEILRRIDEESDRVLHYALKALAKCGSSTAISTIQRVLSRPQPDYVRKAGEDAIRRCTRWW